MSLISPRPASTLAIWGGYAPLYIHDPTKATPHVLSEPGPVARVAFVPTGRFASGGWNGLVILWFTRTGIETNRFRGHATQILDLSFDPTGERLASCDIEGVHVFDTTKKQSWRLACLPSHRLDVLHQPLMQTSGLPR